jgi:hypothetical protein
MSSEERHAPEAASCLWLLDPGVRAFAVAASLPGEIRLTIGDGIDRRRFVSCIAK